jgi:signal transduction histidine kinase
MSLPDAKPPATELHRTAEQLARLIDVSVTLNSTLNVDELLKYIIHTGVELLNCESVSLMLYDERRQRLIFAAATGSDPKKLAEIPVPLDGSLAGTIFKENRTLILKDVASDPRHFVFVSRHVSFETRSLLGVPMRVKGRPTGVIEALNKRDGDFDQADADLLTVIASQAAVAIHNAQLVKALQDAYEEIRSADQLKGNFLALASHELRTPLGIILGYATFLHEDSSGETSEHAQHVLHAAIHMRSLVEAMTNLNMLRDKGLVLHRVVVPLQQILQNAYGEVKSLADARHQQVSLSLPEQPMPVQADPEKLTTAFVNLLNNAVRFTPEGGQIVLGAQPQKANVLAWVQDNGIGIPRKELQRIFDEFYQVEDHMTRRHGGLGIGLTIAKGIVDSHGGQIWADSEGPGKGSIFRIMLPLADETK